MEQPKYVVPVHAQVRSTFDRQAASSAPVVWQSMVALDREGIPDSNACSQQHALPSYFVRSYLVHRRTQHLTPETSGSSCASCSAMVLATALSAARGKYIPGTWYQVHAHPGARVLKYAPPIHSIPLPPNQYINRTFTSHSIQAKSSHSVRVRVRVRVRVGWPASGATAKIPLHTRIPRAARTFFACRTSGTTYERTSLVQWGARYSAGMCQTIEPAL